MIQTSRQRVLEAFNHRTPDRIPIELGSTRASGIHVEAYQKLKTFLHHSDKEKDTIIKFCQVAIPSESILEHFGVDFRPIMIGAPKNFENIKLPNEVWQDEWGVRRTKPEGSHYYDLQKSPLDDENLQINDLHAYPWPDPEDSGRIEGISERYHYLREKTDYAIVLHLGAELGLQTQYLRGFEQWFLDLAMRKEFAHVLLDKVFDYQLSLTDFVLKKLPGQVDVIYLVDDFATQQGLMISPKTYRSYLKPKQKALVDFIKSRTDAKIMLHLCGSVVDILDDLIEIGIDAINPVQISAKGMEPENLKSRFGDRLVFWGAVDGQHILPKGSVSEVKSEVVRLIRIFGEGGGFVLGPCHNIQPDVPPENICAMYEAALSY